MSSKILGNVWDACAAQEFCCVDGAAALNLESIHRCPAVQRPDPQLAVARQHREVFGGPAERHIARRSGKFAAGERNPRIGLDRRD